MIFRRYAELGSVALLKAELDRLGLVSKRAVSRSSSRRRELLRLSKDLPHDWSEQRHVLGFAA